MKKFLQVAYKITILVSVCSVLMSTIPAYHLLASADYKPVYKQLLFMNLKLILLWVAIFIIGCFIMAFKEAKKPVKRKGFSNRLLKKG